ncbi:MAG: hypothetical protein V4497_07275 [Bacteroidota bacterium]
MASYKNQNTELDKAIARLELERDLKFEELKDQLAITYESVKPINLLKETLEDFKHSPDIKSNFLQSVVSIAGGYLSKKMVMGKSNSIFKKIMGYVLQYGLTNFISKKVNSNS